MKYDEATIARQAEATAAKRAEATSVAERTEAVVEALGLNGLLQELFVEDRDMERIRIKVRIASAIISDRSRTYAAHHVEGALDRLTTTIRDRPAR